MCSIETMLLWSVLPPDGIILRWRFPHLRGAQVSEQHVEGLTSNLGEQRATGRLSCVTLATGIYVFMSGDFDE